MASYVLRRLLGALPVLVLASIFVFAILHLVPGDPAVQLAGPDASNAQVQSVRHQLGLDQPLPEQYLRWAGGALHGDLGASFASQRSVMNVIRTAAGPTFELAVAAFLLMLVAGIPLGVIAGTHQRSLWDWSLSLGNMLFIALPHFVIGILMLYVISFKLGWLPIGGAVSVTQSVPRGLRYLALPAIALGLTHAAVLARFVRASVAQVMNQDYIRTARAKGLAERLVVVRHGLRNGLIAVVTIVALQVGGLLAGSVVVENVFSRPGIGRLVVTSIEARDYPTVQGILLLLVALFIVVNLVADLSYGLIDPRIRVR